MAELSLGNALNASVPAPAFRPLGLRLPAPILAELLDGGQAFRWHRQPDGIWRGGWGPHAIALFADAEDALHWRPLTAATTPAEVASYFDRGRDDPGPDALPWRSDPVLAAAMAAFPGLSILRQPLGETLLGFLCSSTKQIVQIKEMMALLAQRFGQPLTPAWHRLPTWPELREVPLDALRACKLGYRARYIAATAEVLAATPGWENRVLTAPYPEAKAFLCGLPGVGEKIADCVLLFGADKLEAFPVDTWIIKVMAEAYGLHGWKPPQVAHFGRVHFGPLAGWAQQFLFAWARSRRTLAGPKTTVVDTESP